MTASAEMFKFLLTEKVSHPDDPVVTFTVIRRWLDVDAPEGANRFYFLRSPMALWPGEAVGPIPEAKLSLAVD